VARKDPSTAGRFSSAKRMMLPLGRASDPDAVRGYPIDMRVKAQTSQWPPVDAARLHDDFVSIAQYGLGCHERWILGEGEDWLQAALAVGRFLVEAQEHDGSWLNRKSFEHSFPLRAPWRCGMAQGEAASLLVRLYLQTGDEGFADAARIGLAPFERPPEEGGVGAWLGGSSWPEEYPTKPASYVLNGAIFAWWGMRDVGLGLGDESATAAFQRGVDTLADNLHRFDTGWWSIYSLYPHPLKPIASSFYHLLHVTQLEAMQLLSPRPAIGATRIRWAEYLESPWLRRRALAQKIAYRLVVPRNRLLGPRLPWARF
jgi:heparosan-N-sulfate-glucuronate 5-epimerase